jgi:HEPN domain-containing protein
MWPTPLEIICFHCQQAVEKYLKGFLVFHGEEPPYIHDLDKLCKQCKSIEPLFAEVVDICSRITQYGVQPRYPAEISIDKADMLRALHDTQAVSAFMRRTAPAMFQEPAPGAPNY